ncbi:MAG: cytochrome c, partial [Gemmatimonadetes bacterium]|nr:cytochrome c [Gemmatimonadota bacterium]NIR74744.1 cytochrome c [Candidatus Kutchimonas denitrificans]NIS01494.1 cytochrome c [Gemmatimonadota bacterium]NIT67235.1 cytochrome c [Gemmatimonadota bacterium]NIU52409.1 c-type cytochrome [Gemmatimonadota bacterium]
PQARVRGRRLFLKHCALCHGERGDGQGRRGYLSVRPADFTDPAWRDGMTARRAYYIEREGIRGTPMPAWKALSEEETWDLVAYVLSVAEMGPRVEVE